MKTVIIYDNKGVIFSRHIVTDEEINMGWLPEGIPYLILDNCEAEAMGENYRPILSVDVSKTSHEPIYGLTKEEEKFANMSLDEYKTLRQEENKAALANFLLNNPILWNDGLYYGVTLEDQNEMNLDLSTYQFKQSIGDTDWELQWHSIKSDCRTFTIEEFSGLLNAIVNFVYPYRQLEMKYKEAIYTAETKEEVAAVELNYSLEV